MGDVVCSLPLCQAIREKHLDCILIFVTSAGFKKIAEVSGAADVVFGSKIWCWPFRFPSNFHFLGLVEAVYCPVNPDEINPENGASGHLVESLANSCGLFPKNLQPTLYPCEDDIAVYRTKYAHGHKQLLIAINGGPTWPVRMWQTKKWQALVDKIHEEFSAEILLLGQMQAGRGADLMALRGVTNLFDQIDPREIPALLKACDLLVAIDSGPIHIAGAVGTPVVGLFGAVNPKFRMPPDSPGKALVGNVPCLYCNHRIPVGHWKENCPHEIACMKAITVDEVFQAMKEILEKKPKAALCMKKTPVLRESGGYLRDISECQAESLAIEERFANSGDANC
jgi:ADP-heptose:LPS heptosyltransferase